MNVLNPRERREGLGREETIRISGPGTFIYSGIVVRRDGFEKHKSYRTTYLVGWRLPTRLITHDIQCTLGPPIPYIIRRLVDVGRMTDESDESK